MLAGLAGCLDGVGFLGWAARILRVEAEGAVAGRSQREGLPPGKDCRRGRTEGAWYRK